jgi:hypothetical protein
MPYLISPEQSIALLAFRVAPDSQKLLQSLSDSGHFVYVTQPCIPRCPICEHGWPSLWRQASQAAFQ